MKLIKEIKKIRIDNGLTMAELERKLGNAKTTQSRIESGNLPISVNYIKKIVHCLELGVEEETFLMVMHSNETAKAIRDKDRYHLDLRGLDKDDKEYSVRVATSFPLLEEEKKEIIKNIVKG